MSFMSFISIFLLYILYFVLNIFFHVQRQSSQSLLDGLTIYSLNLMLLKSTSKFSIISITALGKMLGGIGNVLTI